MNELEEIRSNAYESSKMYKELMKGWHDWHIHQREFRDEDLVLLFKSRLKVFTRKLCSSWLGPFKPKKVHSYGVIDIGTEAISTFKVNGSWVKHYYAGEPINEKVSYNLPDAASS